MVVYTVLSAVGHGVSGEYGGIFYRAVILAALLYACCRAFWTIIKTGVTDTLLAAALGLATFAVNELYSFAYIYLLRGSAMDMTVGNYSRNCAYLFFTAAVFSLFPSFHKIPRISVSALSATAILLIFYGVVAGNSTLLYYSALAVVLLCILPTVYLIIKGNRPAKAFGLAILAIGILDSANRLLILFDPGWHWRDMALAFYPVMYLLLCFTALRFTSREGGDRTDG
ncbi:MAG: hypothetical protein LBJ11_07630 [Oscillospiraceae bacterium]|nr:hypothetical protein [Oscillospiraceae bacterium]